MYIREIRIQDYPIIVFSDVHCDIENVRKLKEKYCNNTLISLGDITNLFEKNDGSRNISSIEYFIQNNIPTLESNHESFLVGASKEDKFITQRVLGNPPNYNLSAEHLQFLENLPRGFKLVLSDGANYYCFHNLPRDLWSFPDKITEAEFKTNYIFDENSLGVICGHLHLNHIDNFTPKRYVIGQLSGKDHHTGESTGGNYIVINKDGIKYKKI